MDAKWTLQTIVEKVAIAPRVWCSTTTLLVHSRQVQDTASHNVSMVAAVVVPSYMEVIDTTDEGGGQACPVVHDNHDYFLNADFTEICLSAAANHNHESSLASQISSSNNKSILNFILKFLSPQIHL